MKKSIILMFLVGVLLTSGCMCRMTGIAPSSTTITADDSYTVIGPTSSSSFGMILGGLIPISESNPSEKCVQRALKKTGGNALIEVTQDNIQVIIPYLMPYWTRVQATAVKVERGGAKK